MRLSEKAVLVKYSSGMPGNTRKDKVTTDQVQKIMSLGKSGRYLKQLYPDNALAPASKIQDEFYNWLQEHSLPWPDKGLVLLPSTMHFEVCEKAREFKSKFAGAVEEFFNHFPEWEAWGRKEHNGTFDPGNYDERKARRAFYFDLEFRPVPESSQYASDIAQLIGGDAQELDNMVQTATAEAMSGLWQRLRAPLAHMVEFLNTVDGKERTRFCASLLTNISEIADLIPALNIAQDPALAGFAKQVRQSIEGLSIDALKDNKNTREETARKAAEILKQMDGYFRPTTN